MKKLMVIFIGILLLNPIIVDATTTTTTTGTNITTSTSTTQRSEEYITPTDLQSYQEKLQTSKGVVSLNIGDVFIYKVDDEKEIRFILAEKKGLTDKAYNSLLSIIEVMFDTNTVQYFKINYPEIAQDKDFLGFSIKVNPARFPWEDNLLKVDDYQFIRVVVDRSGANEGVKGMIVEEKDWKTIIREIFTDQEKLASAKILGISVMDILIGILIIILLIYIALAFYFSRFHKLLYGSRSIMAFLPIFNIYILGKLVLNRILGLFLVLVAGGIGGLYYYKIIPDWKVLLICIGGYAACLFIIYIYSVFKYDRVRSESGEITLKKLKVKKNKNQVDPLPSEEVPSNTPIVLSNELNNVQTPIVLNNEQVQNNDANNNNNMQM